MQAATVVMMWYSGTQKWDPNQPQCKTNGKLKGRGMDDWYWKSHDFIWMH